MFILTGQIREIDFSDWRIFFTKISWGRTIWHLLTLQCNTTSPQVNNKSTIIKVLNYWAKYDQIWYLKHKTNGSWEFCRAFTVNLGLLVKHLGFLVKFFIVNFEWISLSGYWRKPDKQANNSLVCDYMVIVIKIITLLL